MIGKTVSHYRIVGLLGRGGMGEVYKAEDLRLGRQVALKVLPGGARGDPTARARLEREARAASRLDHPNLGVVHEIGETDDGAIFVAMAHYDGHTLRDLIDDEPLAIDQAVDLARQIAEGLQAAHSAGVVHRDVKPSNVVVTQDGKAKVIDFGIATLAGAEPLTKTAAVTGSAHYMAPEQARGEQADARADVWALGVVLYEMLTGRRPFDGAYAQAVLYQVAHEEPPNVRGLRPDVSEALAGVVKRCLQKDPAGRYTTAGAMGDDLQRVATATVVEGPPRKASRWAMLPAAILAVVAIAAVTAVVNGRDGSSSQPETALVRYDDSSQVDDAIRALQSRLDAAPEDAPAHAALGEAYWWRWWYHAPDDSTALRLARQHTERALRLDPEFAGAHVADGLLLFGAGAPLEAVDAFRTGLGLDSSNAAAKRGLGDAYRALGDTAAAIRWYEGAVRSSPTHWAGPYKLGIVEYYRGDYDAAGRHFQAALDLAPGNLYATENLAGARFEQRQFEEAETLYERVIGERPNPTAHTNLGTIYFYWEQDYQRAAVQYRQALRYDDRASKPWGYLGEAYAQLPNHRRLAEEAFQRAVALLEAEPDWRRDPASVSRLATYYASLGNRDRALDLIGLATVPWTPNGDVALNVASTYAALVYRERAQAWVCEALVLGNDPYFIARVPAFSELRVSPGGCAATDGPDVGPVNSDGSGA